LAGDRLWDENSLRKVFTECYCRPRPTHTIKDAWVAYHDEYLDIVIGMVHVELSSFVLLWIIDETRSTFKELRALVKLRLIESVRKSCAKVIDQRRLMQGVKINHR